MENGISMNLKTVRLLWNGKMDRGVLPFVESLIPKLVTNVRVINPTASTLTLNRSWSSSRTNNKTRLLNYAN